MTKSQLTPGMIAVRRDSDEYLVLPNKFFGIGTQGVSLLRYNEDLTVGDCPNADIMQVYTTTADTSYVISNPNLRTLVWERQEFKYPLYCKSLVYSANCTERYEYIVEFTTLCAGTVVFSDVPEVYHLDYTTVGHTASNWPSHTDENWEIVDAPVTPTPLSLEDICEKLGVVIIGEFKPSAKQYIANELSKLLEE